VARDTVASTEAAARLKARGDATVATGTGVPCSSVAAGSTPAKSSHHDAEQSAVASTHSVAAPAPTSAPVPAPAPIAGARASLDAKKKPRSFRRRASLFLQQSLRLKPVHQGSDATATATATATASAAASSSPAKGQAGKMKGRAAVPIMKSPNFLLDLKSGKAALKKRAQKTHSPPVTRRKMSRKQRKSIVIRVCGECAFVTAMMSCNLTACCVPSASVSYRAPASTHHGSTEACYGSTYVKFPLLCFHFVCVGVA